MKYSSFLEGGQKWISSMIIFPSKIRGKNFEHLMGKIRLDLKFFLSLNRFTNFTSHMNQKKFKLGSKFIFRKHY